MLKQKTKEDEKDNKREEINKQANGRTNQNKNETTEKRKNNNDDDAWTMRNDMWVKNMIVHILYLCAYNRRHDTKKISCFCQTNRLNKNKSVKAAERDQHLQRN